MNKILLTLAVLCLFGAGTASATSELQPLPEVKSLDVNTFVENSKLVSKKFNVDEGLNFQIQVPNDFTVKSDELLKNIDKNGHVFGEVFYAFGPAIETGRPYIKVETTELDRWISAKNWLITKSLEWGYTLRGIEGDEDGNQYEAFYIRLDQYGNTEVVRGLGFLNEDRLVIVEYVIPVALWDVERDKQLYTIKSFEFLNKYDVRAPEVIKEFSYLDTFYFKYPDSWVFLKRDNNDVNSLDVNLKTTDKNGFVFAEADITVVSSKSLKDRVDQTVYPFNLPDVIEDRIKRIDRLGFDTDKIMEQHEYKLSFNEDFQTTEVYPLRKKVSSVYVSEDKNPVTKEFWLTVLKRPKAEGKNYVISMIAPSRQVNLTQWAYAVKAYEEMIKSIK